MHQSIPAVPIPPPRGICSRFSPWGGAFEILLLPGGWAFAYPQDDPGAFEPLSGFGLACNIWIFELSKIITFVKIFYNLFYTDHAFSVLR